MKQSQNETKNATPNEPVAKRTERNEFQAKRTLSKPKLAKRTPGEAELVKRNRRAKLRRNEPAPTRRVGRADWAFSLRLPEKLWP